MGKVDVGMRIREWVKEPLTTTIAGRSRRSCRPILAAGALVGLTIVAAACGSSGASPAVSTKASGGASHSSTATVTVSVAQVGTLGTVLVDQSGFTLYRYTLDGKDVSNCTGACAAVWTPLIVPTGGVLKAGIGVKDTLLATIVRPGGARQVAFNGMPLYLYTGDKKSGQTTGQGVEGTWFVVSPSVPASKPSTSSTTTAPTSTRANGGTSATTAPTISPSVPAPTTSPTTFAPPATSSPNTSPPSTSPPATTTTTTPPGGGGYGY